MGDLDIVDRVLLLRYAWLTPWVKVVRLSTLGQVVITAGETPALARLRTFLDDELYNWLPEACVGLLWLE